MCLQSCSFLRFLRLGSCLSLPGSVPVSPAAVGLSLPEDGEGGGLWALVAWRLAAGKAFLPSALFLFFGISSSSLCTPCAQCCKAHKGSLRLLLVSHPLRIKFPFWLWHPPALPLQRYITSYSITNFYLKKWTKNTNFREGFSCQRPLKLLPRLSIALAAAWWVQQCALSSPAGRKKVDRQRWNKSFPWDLLPVQPWPFWQPLMPKAGFSFSTFHYISPIQIFFSGNKNVQNMVLIWTGTSTLFKAAVSPNGIGAGKCGHSQDFEGWPNIQHCTDGCFCCLNKWT